MPMKLEDRWHCTNPACGCEVLIDRGATGNGKNSCCSCGSPMKKRYVSPVLAYLDFLRLDPETEAVAHEN